MPEDHYTPGLSDARKGSGTLRTVLGTAFLAFITGAAVLGYAVWDGRLSLTAPQPVAAPSPAATAAPNATPTAAPIDANALNQQIATLEARLARIDLQAAAAEGSSARAEALLLSLAARRAVERGAPLGYIEEQLKARFGTARPGAVAAVVAEAKSPTTLAVLSGDLDRLGPALVGNGADDSAWSRFRRQMSGLFVVHRDPPGASAPENRLARAQLLLRSGQVEQAVEIVAALPGSKAAAEWIAAARRHGAALDALDQLDQAALAEPAALKDSSGEAVRQPGLDAGPAATPAPAASEASF